MPHFVASRVARRRGRAASAVSYAPWLVANVTLDRPPRRQGRAARLGQCLVDQQALGYVVATHQAQAAINDPPS